MYLIKRLAKKNYNNDIFKFLSDLIVAQVYVIVQIKLLYLH